MTRYVEKTACMSADGRYRYSLSRGLEPGARTVAFVGVNPSTADAWHDDPTIRRCAAFARVWGFHRLLMGNLYAWRATDPAMLPFDHDVAVGPENEAALAEICREAEIVVCAWGRNIRPAAVLLGARLLALPNAKCLGWNRDGSPKHPLYLPGTSVPIPVREAIR